MEHQPPPVVTYDEWLLSHARALRAPQLTRFFLEITALGSGTVLICISLGTLTLLGAAARWRSFVQFFTVGTASWLLMEFLKKTVARERPPLEDRLDLVTGFSFPSGHSMSSSAIYFTLAFLLLPPLKGAARRGIFLAYVSFFVCLIGLSRVYLGVHFPSDVCGGLCLGLSLACLSHIGFQRLKWPT